MESTPGSIENLQSASATSMSKKAKNRGGGDNVSEVELKHQEKEKTLVEHLDLLHPSNPYRELDARRHEIRQRIREKFQGAPKTVLDQAEENKPPIERRLEDTDKVLADLLAFGTEIITNIKVANEKRELLRRDFEANQRVDLQSDLHKESTEATARYNDIVARWSELGEFKEPMVMFEKLEEQKDRIADLMQSKEEMIAQCQREIDRMNQRFEQDQEKQQTDMCAMVERIDGQIELLKNAYRHHLDLLQDTIESERQTIALKEESKWNEFYNTMQDNEQHKLEMAKQKKQFYASEIKRITAQQEEITRATRIRLEKDAEMLEFELRSTKNQVLMNSEKLDYNYQVLQKRNEENVIINNQQKRRVAKLSEALSEVKKRIQMTQANAENVTTKLSNDIQKLHDSITDLAKKSENFRMSNRKKFFSIWSINFEELKSLIEKVFDIDRILHEQQLGVPWKRPDVNLEEFPLVASQKLFSSENKVRKSEVGNRVMSARRTLPGSAQPMNMPFPSTKERYETSKKQATELTQKAEEERKRHEQRIEVRLVRNILRKIADRGGFLVEDRLLEFLEPYTEEQKTLVRIDNIFAALRITDMEAVNKLVEFFRPYSWCPNCMKGIPRKQLKKLYSDCQKTEEEEIFGEQENDSCSSDKSDSAMPKNSPGISETEQCKDHFLIVESAMVLTALNEFTNHQIESYDENRKKGQLLHSSTLKIDSETNNEKPKTPVCSIEVDNETIRRYWQQFLNFMPKEKQNLWHSLEHGLQHYLEVLKQREQLDKECAFLRQQNAELKHLLQKFNV